MSRKKSKKAAVKAKVANVRTVKGKQNFSLEDGPPYREHPWDKLGAKPEDLDVNKLLEDEDDAEDF